MSSSLIWFQLVDSVTGLSYKGSSVDYVSLPPGSVIAQFRDAVKKKDKDDGDAAILTPFKSSQLIVYKNKSAFDKRNLEEGKEKPLKSNVVRIITTRSGNVCYFYSRLCGSYSERDYTGLTLEQFCNHSGPRARIIDECQCTYHDLSFWQELVKEKLSHQYPGLVLLLAGSFGLDVQSSRFGTPISFPIDNQLNLHESSFLPGLQLSREEFDEMIHNTQFMEIANEIWDFCDAHIGIVNTVLKALQEKIRSKQKVISSSELLSYLYSDRMINLLPTKEESLP